MVLIAVIACLIAARCAFPWALCTYLNARLSTPGIYQGHIVSISLAFYRGAYALNGVRLTVDRDGYGPEPLLSCSQLAFAISWSDLIYGRLRAHVDVDRPIFILSVAQGNSERVDLPDHRVEPHDAKPSAGENEEKSMKSTWQDRVQSLIAFRIDELRFREGTFHYEDAKRDIRLSIEHIDLEMRNLVDGAHPSSKSVPARVEAHGLTTGLGRLAVSGDVRPWVIEPNFVCKLALIDLELPALNPSTKHRDGLAFNAGRLSTYIEMTAKNGKVKGLPKLLVRGLDVRRFNGADAGVTKLFWQATIALGETVLVNDETGALAARIPLQGRIDGPNTDV